MSSFRKVGKSNQRPHRERSQPAARSHLGILEKKKDYKLRADDFQRKRDAIKGLKRKALDKNPDEFYFKMVKTKMEDGVHQTEDKLPVYTDEQLKLMQSQDLKYINYKRSIEQKKIEKLKSSLHMIDAVDKPKNKHTIFVDSKKEAKKFDASKHFDTHPALLGRTYNRPRMEQLKAMRLKGTMDDDTMESISEGLNQKYKELTKRIEREKQLAIVARKMEMKKALMDKKAKKKKVQDETPEQAALYKWLPQRKR